ncbi:eIF2A-related protein [Thermogemmatispora onikobensis]|uniref:WD40 domain-containing protein n=1 Tax=Thermogemmatispora onikobensis TaxID=732234 RepID=UPI000853C630|nr:PD40 domain-containing protein [Thermogemmatispora onikobensis]
MKQPPRPPCPSWAEKLALRLEDLPPADREALQAHLQRCPVCAAARADYELIDARLQALPDPVLKPVPRLAALMSKFANEEEEHSSQALGGQTRSGSSPSPYHRPGPVRRSRQRVWAAVAALIAACLMLVLGLPLLYQLTESGGATSPGTLLVTYYGHTSTITSLTWSPDGSSLASSDLKGSIEVWNPLTNTQRYRYEPRAGAGIAYTVAWSPNGHYLAAAFQNHTVEVWNTETGQRIYSFTRHTDIVYALAWSPDSRRLASGGGDNSVWVWDATTGADAVVYNGIFSVKTLAWSPDGNYLAAGDDGDIVRIWNVHTSNPETPLLSYTAHSGSITALSWSPDGRYLASASMDGTVRVWDAHNGTTLRVYTGHRGRVDAVAWSHDERFIASAGADATVQVWNPFNGEVALIYRKHSEEVNAVAWSPNDHYLASAGWDHTVQVWRAP